MTDLYLPTDSEIGAWTPDGRFFVEGRAGGPLGGLTFAAKDLFDVAGHRTGAGNPTWLETHPPADRNSAIVQQLLDAGADLVGKTITDELAYSLHGDNVHYGAPINAAAPDRVTGGSSSGSAAAVAARLVDFALGTDTGGSTRAPASYCGIWGLRPTHGLLSMEGLAPLHPSYDTPTWLAHDPEVFTRVGAVLLPHSDWRPARVLRFEDACAQADDAFAEPLEHVRRALEDVVGATTLPARAASGAALEDWRGVYATSGAHEGWRVHGEWITRHAPTFAPIFAPPIAARWRIASQVSDADAAAAWKRVTDIRAQVRALIGADGVALLPSAASLAPLRNADPASVDATRLRTMAITCIGGLSGLPQVSLPFFTADGDPVGVSLMGPAGSDLALIRLATEVHRAATSAIGAAR